MLKKKKTGLVLTLMRRNSSPLFCALVPQVRVYLNTCIFRHSECTLTRQKKLMKEGGTSRLVFTSYLYRSRMTYVVLQFRRDSEVLLCIPTSLSFCLCQYISRR